MLDELRQKFLELKPFHVKNVVKNLMDWEQLEHLLNLRPFTNSKRFIFSLEKKYSWPAGGWLTDYDSLPPQIIQELIDENVCYLRDASRVNKNINTVASDLEKIFLTPVDAHIFFYLNKSKTNSLGFGKHKDYSHNLITLAKGKQKIKVWFDNNETTYDLEEGDGVFVPANVFHQVIADQKRIGVSFPINTTLAFMQERQWVKL